jgi:hypothetical protein
MFRHVSQQLIASAMFVSALAAQTVTSGEIAGTVIDPSKAAVPNAAVTVTNDATGTTQRTTTNTRGLFRVSFLPPGHYSVSISSPGFQQAKRGANVTVGQTVEADFQLAISGSTQTVTIEESVEGIQTENANLSTTFNVEQLQTLPNPGNDLSYVAQLAPGAVMNTQAGYGNFSTYGLPANANVFTLNGNNDMDPYLNLNNSGATNLLLGNNEIAQAVVVNNGYTGQYGGLAGSQVNYVTKSGTNKFHGNADWFWNGRAMNANDFFNNASGTPRPFDNANQWAASAGGPVWKDRTFFFADYEGLRVVLPTSVEARIPSPQFAQATLANLSATGQAAAVPFYQNMFNLWANAPGAAGATPIAGGGCGSFTLLGAGVPCALQFRSTAGNFTHEYLFSGRVDQVIGQDDRAYVRVQRDNGVQATYTDPIDPAFNAFSNQPEMQAQVGETHTFGATAVNQFIFSGQYYRALFGPPSIDAQRSVFPTTVRFAGTLFSSLGGEDYLWPQGRNVTQYQLVDDYSKVVGRHNFQTGVNFRRNDISDYTFGRYTSGRITENNLLDFYNGGGLGNSLVIHFPTQVEQPIALYGLGGYVQDEWQLRSNLKLTVALRVDHNSNPVCQHDCFAALAAPFTALNHDPNVPYDQAIQNNLNSAFPGLEALIWQPRVGFAWSPGRSAKTVLRGGVGVFGSALPGSVVDFFATNTPQLNSFTVSNAPLTPSLPNSLLSTAMNANQSLLHAFNSGGTLASISASNPYFVAPGFNSMDRNTVKQPRFYEWNLEVQRELPEQVTLSVNYVGNRGVYIPVQNNNINAFCDPATCPGGFAGLPAFAPDPRFGVVNELMSSGYSRYNGLSVSLRRPMTHGLQFQFNYTWSHAFDTVSNLGFEPFNYDTNYSILNPQNPYNINANNWGNADYDIRQYVSISYVWDDALRHLFHWGPNAVFSGWTISGTIFHRTGMPFTVIDSNATAALNADNYGGAAGLGGGVFATVTGSGPQSCGSSAVDTPCFGANQFAPPQNTPSQFGNQARNQYYGPGFFDTDLSVMKSFQLPRWESAKVSVGAQVFNLFNHVNFDQPVNDIANPQFGMSILAVGPPTSILGSFLGGDASPRIIQIKAQFVF